MTMLRQHREELSSLESAEERIDRLCELNVRAQVQSLADSPILRDALERGQQIAVHGWIYRLSDGRLHDLTGASNVRSER